MGPALALSKYIFCESLKKEDIHLINLSNTLAEESTPGTPAPG